MHIYAEKPAFLPRKSGFMHAETTFPRPESPVSGSGHTGLSLAPHLCGPCSSPVWRSATSASAALRARQTALAALLSLLWDVKFWLIRLKMRRKAENRRRFPARGPWTGPKTRFSVLTPDKMSKCQFFRKKAEPFVCILPFLCLPLSGGPWPACNYRHNPPTDL